MIVPVRRTRLARALPALVLAIGFLAACGDDATSDGSDRRLDAAGSDESSSPLTPRTASFAVFDDARAELALLSATNLGPGFEADTAPETEEPAEPGGVTEGGCESETSFEDRLDPDGIALGDADIDYFLFDETRLMAVTSAVSSFGDEGTAEAALQALVDDIGQCTHFEDASEDGTETTVLDVEVDEAPATEDVDGQLSMVGGGTWTYEGQSVPIGLGFSAARVDANVTMVMLVSIGVAEDSELLAPYTEIAADRLAAVAAGETPEDVAAPLPGTAPPARVPVPGVPGTLEDFFASAPGIVGGE